MTRRRRTPPVPRLVLALGVDGGRVAAHLVDASRGVALCGLHVDGDPMPDGEGRITCVSCARLVRYASLWRR